MVYFKLFLIDKSVEHVLPDPAPISNIEFISFKFKFFYKVSASNIEFNNEKEYFVFL